MEIELESEVIRGDLHEIDRLKEMEEQQQGQFSSLGGMYFSYQAYSEGF